MREGKTERERERDKAIDRESRKRSNRRTLLFFSTDLLLATPTPPITTLRTVFYKIVRFFFLLFLFIHSFFTVSTTLLAYTTACMMAGKYRLKGRRGPFSRTFRRDRRRGREIRHVRNKNKQRLCTRFSLEYRFYYCFVPFLFIYLLLFFLVFVPF